MIPVTAYRNETVAVLGLGRSGLSATHALHDGGAIVAAWDDNEAARTKARDIGVEVTPLQELDWSTCSALVMSPGIPLTFPVPHPVAVLAKNHDCEIISDVELLWRTEQATKFIGITGTNGKSTTTVLLGHILEQAGQPVGVGGNLGTPALDLPVVGEGGVYVLELSSYQLDLCPSAMMDIAILLNITPDHLDRHGGVDGYIKAKRQIFENQTTDGIAVIGIDDEETCSIFRSLNTANKQRVVPISSRNIATGGVYVDGGMLVDDLDGEAVGVCDLSSVMALPGIHNRQNAAAAYAAARLAGLDRNDAVNGIASYPGLVHRQERLGDIDGVTFVNDSKATNPDAAAKALGSYTNIYWIAGGRGKDTGYAVLDPHIGNVRHAFLVGEAAQELHDIFAGRIGCRISGTIDVATHDAFTQARQDAYDSPVVLLSPACASFDQFPNFEERGEFFKKNVYTLDMSNDSLLSDNSIVAGGFV